MIAYVIVTIGTIGLILTHNIRDPSITPLNMIFTFIVKFGASMSYQGVFLIVEVFPLIFYSTIFGICNVFGIIANILSIEFLDILDNDVIRFSILIILSLAAIVLANLFKECR